MKVFTPLGYTLSEEQKNDWIAQTDKLTEAFLQIHPVHYRFLFRTEEYRKFIITDRGDISTFVTPMWLEHYHQAEKYFLSEQYDLFNDSALQYAFFLTAGGAWLNQEISFLESRWPQEVLKLFLREDPFFIPRISSSYYQTSETLVNHLTHLTVFSEACQKPIQQWGTTVEFGGGYGSMARLLSRIQGGAPRTHIIIDLPVFLFIQDCYLKNCLDGSSVNLCGIDSEEIIPGKINLVSIADTKTLQRIKEHNPFMFIATWSLSEANQASVKRMHELDYFESKFISFGYRHYETMNPRQPMSHALTVPQCYETICKTPAFYAGAAEHYYWVNERKA
jgi:hypothetical protein